MAERRQRMVDLTPLRSSPAFARLWIGQALAGIGTQMTVVAVGLKIFDLTHSTFAVGLVGGIALIPMLIAGPWGGVLADSFDRRTVLLSSLTVSWLATISLLGLTITDAVLKTQGSHVWLWPFYVVTTIQAMAATVSGAARMSLYPRILPTDLVAGANALSGMSMGVQFTVGPALAGILVAAFGFPVAFGVDALLACAAFFGVFTLPKLPPLVGAPKRGWAALREGFMFLKGARTIRTSFLADVIAMGLGRPYALLPAVAATVIGGGPTTVGVLTAAGAIGTFSTSLFSGPVKHVHRYGLAISRAIMVYGVFVLMLGVVIATGMFGAFGTVGSDWSQVSGLGLVLAALCFVGMGASDEVSAIFRSTMLLTAAPDEMRGRIQGVFFSVVAGGPRLGDLFTGVMAAAVALWAPPVFGGILIVVLIATLVRLNPSFANYDKRNPTL